MKTPIRHGSKKAGRKTKGILIRVTEAQKRLLAKTAKNTGLGLSSWMLSLALHAAQGSDPRSLFRSIMKRA